MQHRTIKLSPESHDFVLSRVESGRYEDAGDVIQAAMRALDREEKSAQVERFRRNIAQGDVFRQLWEASASTLNQRHGGSGTSAAQL
jgi:putative addiction module CopG family antidote